MRAKILKIYLSIFIIGSVYLLWIFLTGVYIPCFYYTTSGLLCPGCGISRMLISLLRLDIRAAFFYNPVIFIILVIWNLIALLCFANKPQWIQTPRFLYTALGITVIVLILWGIVRNVI